MARTDARPSKNHTPQIHAYRALLAATKNITTPCDEGQGAEWFSDDEHQQHRAAQLCQTCPALTACAAYAHAANETIGVWGGTTPAQRRAHAQPTTHQALTAGKGGSNHHHRPAGRAAGPPAVKSQTRIHPLATRPAGATTKGKNQ